MPRNSSPHITHKITRSPCRYIQGRHCLDLLSSVVRVVLFKVRHKGACVPVEALEELSREVEQRLWDEARVGDDLHVIL